MTSYFLAFLWGIYIILSLIGWGGVINRILFPKDCIDWGQKAAWGVAFSILVGGILNVTWTISRTTILIYLTLGFVYWAIALYLNRTVAFKSLLALVRVCRKDRVVFLGTLIVFLLIFIQYAAWVSSYEFNPHDDYHGYFVYPKKMLEMGAMGPDPFSARRIVSSLGGAAFLDTFILCMLNAKNLHLIDLGCGLVISVGVILGLLKERNVSTKKTLFILLFFPFYPLISTNISSLIIAFALFLSLYRTLDWQRIKTTNFITSALIISLTTAAICALKSNFVPPAIVCFTLSYFFYILKSTNKKEAISEFLLSTFLVILFLLPWMISMYQSSGTLLYPLLGKGYHGSTYGTYKSPTSQLTPFSAVRILLSVFSDTKVLVVILLSCIVIIRRRYKLSDREPFLSLFIGTVLGTVIVTLAIGGFDRWRYLFSFVAATLSVSIVVLLNNLNLKNKGYFTHTNSVIITVFLVGVLIGHPDYVNAHKHNFVRIKSGLSNAPLMANQEIYLYSKMQEKFPKNETILTRLEKPFLLDFSRNKILIADYPGGSSPPPGMPSFKGSEPLANYLTSKSIRYVAYSYASEAGFSKRDYEARAKAPSYPYLLLLRTEAQHTLDFQDNLKELGESRKRIYDDGKNFVLDLLSREK